MSNLATVYEFEGRYSEAARFYEKALNLRVKLFGDQNLLVIYSLNSLAGVYCCQERYEEAEALLLRESDLTKYLFGEYDQKYASSLNNLAVLYSHQKNYRKAEIVYLESLEILQQLFGEDSQHPDIQLTHQSYSNLLTAAIQSDQAETLSEHPTTQDLIPKIRAVLENP